MTDILNQLSTKTIVYILEQLLRANGVDVRQVEDILQHISLFDYEDDFDNITQFVQFLIEQWKSLFKRCLNISVDLLIEIDSHLSKPCEQTSNQIFYDVFLFCAQIIAKSLSYNCVNDDDISACISLVLNGNMEDDVVSVFDKVTRFMIQNKMAFDTKYIPEIIQLILNYKYGQFDI